MKKLKTKTLRVLSEHGSLSASDLITLEQWENEGGLPAQDSNFFKALSPIRKGDILEVKSTNPQIQDEKLVLEIEVEVLAHAP